MHSVPDTRVPARRAIAITPGAIAAAEGIFDPALKQEEVGRSKRSNAKAALQKLSYTKRMFDEEKKKPYILYIIYICTRVPAYAGTHDPDTEIYLDRVKANHTYGGSMWDPG